MNSYGVLNKGKFEVVYKLEKQLGINYFEQEWQILRYYVATAQKYDNQSLIVKKPRLTRLFYIEINHLI